MPRPYQIPLKSEFGGIGLRHQYVKGSAVPSNGQPNLRTTDSEYLPVFSHNLLPLASVSPPTSWLVKSDRVLRGGGQGETGEGIKATIQSHSICHLILGHLLSNSLGVKGSGEPLTYCYVFPRGRFLDQHQACLFFSPNLCSSQRFLNIVLG